jgi:predicted naringenin-chalcone synthase
VVTARIVGLGSALPGGPVAQDALWAGFFARHHGGGRLAERIFRDVGVVHRQAVANPLAGDDVTGWSTGDRMRRYAAESVPLGKGAVGAALADAGLAADEVGLFAVVSCTGYATPGLDIRVAADLGMAPTVQRLMIGHMGCYAAVPGLGAVADFAAARNRPAALLALELPSLHVQPPTDDIEQVVSHALFGDAAVALVVAPGAGPGLEVVEVAAVTDPATADHMSWDVTDHGFRMGLSPRVPDVLGRHVRPMVDRLLASHGLGIDEVDGWAVHPGGPRILDTVQDRLELPADALAASRAVLAAHGNCSSATVPLVIDALRAAGCPRPGGHAVALAFGPGLTLYAALLRAPDRHQEDDPR